MKKFVDISDEVDSYGDPIEVDSEEAVVEAIRNWLKSSPSDYLMVDRVGGPLDNFVFKNLNDSLDEAEFLLQVQFLEAFGKYVNLEGIRFEPDYDISAMRVQLLFSFKETGKLSGTEVYVKQSKLSPQYTTFYEITESGQDLINFVLLHKPNFPDDTLTYDYIFETWRWGPFKLVNLSLESSEYASIRSIVNS